MMSRQLAPAKSSASNQASTSTAGPADQGPQEENGVPITEEEVVGYREQDRFLPINNIQRLMKRSLPESSKISKDAKECIQEATSEFISFITSEAADRATSEKRKTITGDDILNALKTLGFDEMSEVLLIYLAKYRELQSKEPARKRSRKSSGGGDASKLLNGNTANIGASTSTSAALTMPPPSESLGSSLTMPPSSYAHMLAEAKAGHGGAMDGYDEDDMNGNDDDDGDDALDMLEFPSDNE